MSSSIRTLLALATLAAASPAPALVAVDTVNFRGTSPAIAGSLASLQIDFTNQLITWSSSDSLFGSTTFPSVSPGTWNLSAGRLTFRYDDGSKLLIGDILLSNPDRSVVDLVETPARARYLLKLDPGILPAASISDLTVSEESGVANLTVSLDSEPLQPATLAVTCTPGTAGPLDFDSSPGLLTIPAGRRQVTLSIPLTNDHRVERAESFTVTLGSPERVTIADGSATVTIEDVDTTVVSVYDTAVEEDFPPDARVPIRLSAPSDFNIIVRYNTRDGSAFAQGDFSTRSNDTTFTPGQLESMLYIPVADDALAEGDENFVSFLMNVVGERASLGRTEATITIYDDDDALKTSRVDEIGWQWPNNAVYRPELTHEDYLMTEGTLVLAQNFGHGTPGSTTTVAGIPFTNTGAGGASVFGTFGTLNWSVVAPGGTTSDGLGHPGIDDLFFSEIQSPNPVRLEVSGLDLNKRYVVQILFGEPRAIDARQWEIASDLGPIANGNVGGPLYDHVRRQFGQGPLGNGLAGENPADGRDRRIISFGICARDGFFLENRGWDGKSPSISAFQIREVADYPRSPDVVTHERIAGMLWTGTQLVATCDEGDILTSPETVEWTRRDPVGARRDLNQTLDIDQIGGTLLVTGRFGQLYTSSDAGVTWIPQNSGTTNPLYSIANLGSHVVIVGEGGTILTSTDLITWTPRPSGTTEILVGSAWNGSTLVITGNRGRIVTSSDGLTFSSFQIPAASNTDLSSVIWDGSRFMAVGRIRGTATGNGPIYTSPDGLTWTKLAFEARAALTQLIFTGSLYYVGDQNGSVYTSLDGVNWTEQIPVPNDGARCVAWTGKRFVVGCQNGDFMWSADGVTWSSETGVDLPAPPPLLASSGHAIWAAQQGLPAGTLTLDQNRDGYPDLFNYAMGVPAGKLLPRELPGLLPAIDRGSLPDRPTTVFQLPEALPADLRLDVERSTDGQHWNVIASRQGSGPWDVQPDQFLFEADPVAGFRLTRFAASLEEAVQPLALFRLRATIAP